MVSHNLENFAEWLTRFYHQISFQVDTVNEVCKHNAVVCKLFNNQQLLKSHVSWSDTEFRRFMQITENDNIRLQHAYNVSETASDIKWIYLYFERFLVFDEIKLKLFKKTTHWINHHSQTKALQSRNINSKSQRRTKHIQLPCCLHNILPMRFCVVVQIMPPIYQRR